MVESRGFLTTLYQNSRVYKVERKDSPKLDWEERAREKGKEF
jgi:hypothetical protein